MERPPSQPDNYPKKVPPFLETVLLRIYIIIRVW